MTDKNIDERVEELERDVRAIREEVNSIGSIFSVHEVQCSERWRAQSNKQEEINLKLARIEKILIGSAGSIILFLAGIILKIV